MKSAAILALAISALTIGGCEKVESESARADKRVAQHIRKGEQSLNVGVADEKSVRAAEDALAQAVGEKTASSMTKARANSLLGQAQFEQAKLLIRQIDHNETEIAGVVWEIGRQASTIESASAVIEAMNKRNPAPTLEAVDKQKKKAEGGADEPLWAEKTSIPTLSAAKQEISKLEGQIATRSDQVKTLSQGRMAAIDESEKLMKQSQAEKGQKSVDLYKQGADARKNSEDLQRQVDAEKAALVPLQRDLDVLKGQEKVLTEAVQQFDGQAKEITGNWDDTKKQIEAQQATIKAIVDGGESATTEPDNVSKVESMTQKLAKLTKLAADTTELRKDAIDLLEKASGNYDSAHGAAEQLTKELQAKMANTDNAQVPQQAAWKNMREVYNPLGFRLKDAVVQHALANLQADAANCLEARLKLGKLAAPILEKASVTVPEGLKGGSLDEGIKEYRDGAAKAFGKATDYLDTVAEAGTASPQMKMSANVERVSAYYGWSQLEQATGGKDVATYLAKAKDVMNSQVVANLEEGQSMPVLPAEIAPTPKAVKAPATPEATPTTGESPATAPSEEAATQPATAPATE
ncbi:MAG TPA: hypothetical protein VIL86_21080 [Tepidisphaeraceae bacterium]